MSFIGKRFSCVVKLDTNIFENSDKYKMEVDRNIFPSLSPCLPADELPSCHQTVGRLPWIRLNDGHVSKKVWPPDIHQHFYSKKSINGLILTSPRLPFIFLSTKKNSPFVSIQTLWFLWDWTDFWRLGLSLKCHLKFNFKAKLNKIPRQVTLKKGKFNINLAD